MDDPDKPRQVRKDAKLKNLVLTNAQAHEDLWRFRHPEEGGTALGFDEILVEIPLRYGFPVSLSTLSIFYAWFELKVRMDAKTDAADQLMEELAKSNKFSTDQIKEAGQRLFMTEGIVKVQPKVFFAAVEMQQNDERLQQGKQKIEISREVVEVNKRRLSLLERKAKALDEAAEQMRLLKAGGQLMPDQERAAILDKMDEILGLKK